MTKARSTYHRGSGVSSGGGGALKASDDNLQVALGEGSSPVRR